MNHLGTAAPQPPDTAFITFLLTLLGTWRVYRWRGYLGWNSRLCPLAVTSLCPGRPAAASSSLRVATLGTSPMAMTALTSASHPLFLLRAGSVMSGEGVRPSLWSSREYWYFILSMAPSTRVERK